VLLYYYYYYYYYYVDSLERQVEAMYVEHAQQLEQKDEEHIHQAEEVEALKIKLEVLVKWSQSVLIC
jgi:hypothetical protein